MLLSVSCGYKIVMASDEELDNPYMFIQAIKYNRVNLIQTTPTRLNISILNHSSEILKRIKVIACGGERLVSSMIKKISCYAPDSTFIKVYGPTETTVWSTSSVISDGEKGIGNPSQNTRCYILNRFQKFIPNFETGIIYIAGDGLGQYYHDDKLQKEKYIYLSEVGEKVYNSNDTAYLDDENFIIYSSRIDTQVKINEVRIELGEIESVAKENHLIEECVVVIKEIPNIGKRLVLFYTSNTNIEKETFKGIFSRLPDTYIPSFYMHLDEFPLTTSSKIDRKKLPLPNNGIIKKISPQSNLEILLCDAANDVLKDRHSNVLVGINEPLCEYGIESVDISKMIAFLSRKGYKCNNYKLFNSHRSVFEIAKSLENDESKELIEMSFPKSVFKSYDVCTK